MHAISKEHLSLERVKEIIDHKEKLTLSQEAKEAIVKCLGTGIESFEQLQEVRIQHSDISIQTIEKRNIFIA